MESGDLLIGLKALMALAVVLEEIKANSFSNLLMAGWMVTATGRNMYSTIELHGRGASAYEVETNIEGRGKQRAR